MENSRNDNAHVLDWGLSDEPSGRAALPRLEASQPGPAVHAPDAPVPELLGAASLTTMTVEVSQA